jgi:hypothetical protein
MQIDDFKFLLDCGWTENFREDDLKLIAQCVHIEPCAVASLTAALADTRRTSMRCSSLTRTLHTLVSAGRSPEYQKFSIVIVSVV